MDNEKLMDYRVGLIHSHHTMQAFFSGTDTEELHEKAVDGLYLSLIVNNHMEPVCKLAWMGQIERKIETFNSWDLGLFVRKPKRVMKTELANVFYEIEMEINWDDSISTVADRYNELEDDEKIAAQARVVHRGGEAQTSFFGIDNNGRSAMSRWDEAKEKSNAIYDATNDGLFVANLEKKGILEECFSAILTQDPKTDLTITQALDVLMRDVRTDTQQMEDSNTLPANQDFMGNYAIVAKEHAELVIINGDDIVTEKLNEFYIDDDDYYSLLAKMYDTLSKCGDTIIVSALKKAIAAIALEEEEEEEDEHEKAANFISPV